MCSGVRHSLYSGSLITTPGRETEEISKNKKGQKGRLRNPAHPSSASWIEMGLTVSVTFYMNVEMSPSSFRNFSTFGVESGYQTLVSCTLQIMVFGIRNGVGPLLTSTSGLSSNDESPHQHGLLQVLSPWRARASSAHNHIIKPLMY